MSTFETAQLISAIDKYYVLYTSVILLCIGTIGNVLKFIIFTKIRSFHGNQCAYYLKISSITDTGVLMATLPCLVVDSVLGIKLVGLSPIWCKIQLMFIYTCGLYSVFTMCCIALDQYLSTNHRRTSTIKLHQRSLWYRRMWHLQSYCASLFYIFQENGCEPAVPDSRLYGGKIRSFKL